ncbi:MAG TPA: zinc ribbon domain-containing protein, partial [Candidatus Eisenbacteria bacterium]
VASSLIGVVSMRLVRLLCPRCRDRYVPSGEELRVLGVPPMDGTDLTLFRPVGCDHCVQSGYRGRTGVFEVLEMNEPLRLLMATGAPESAVRRAAIESGMVPIGEDGLAKVIAGETSLEELQRVVFCEEESGRICPSCRGTSSSEFLYCPHCGASVASACGRCARRLDPSWLVCPFCGARREPTEARVPGPGAEEGGGESWPAAARPAGRRARSTARTRP